MAKKANGELKIEKGIPIPEVRGNNKGYAKAMRGLLNKGDSVVLPVSTSRAANIAQAYIGVGNYACRKVEGGARVWRIK